MRYKLTWSAQAAADLLAVWDTVFDLSRNAETADRYAEKLKETVLSLTDHPKTGFPLIYDGLLTGFYSVNYKAYKAFYRVREDRVELLRILPKAADYLRLLFPEEGT